MPYTRHGHAFGIINVDEPRPRTVARCGGPAICSPCAIDAARGRDGLPPIREDKPEEGSR
jgi:hypothetical protein